MKYRKFYTVSLFGNRFVCAKDKVGETLYNYLKTRIGNKCVRVLIGTHGDFDKISFSVCRRLKREGYNIHIILVYTSYKRLQKEMQETGVAWDYRDIETMLYEIEEVYYKRQIIVSNQKMVDESDEIIVYYDGRNQIYSGTYRVIRYAKKNNKTIVNIF
ncbi:MAG: hypothetical protein IJ371_03255 [Clostridia bacterium]|nr:hypothetical protein [Clostridia bacterium]